MNNICAMFKKPGGGHGPQLPTPMVTSCSKTHSSCSTNWWHHNLLKFCQTLQFNEV